MSNETAGHVSAVARTSDNTLRLGEEIREIVVVHGMDFHNDCKLESYHWRLPQDINIDPKSIKNNNKKKINGPYTNRPLAKLIINKDGSAEYFNDKQRVRYKITFVNSKQEFIKALSTPKIMVIYAGHARYGRGPCFGDPAEHVTVRVLTLAGNQEDWKECPRAGKRFPHYPSENWGDGNDKKTWGLFRWGFPYIAIPASEILYYGYHANVAMSDLDLKSKHYDGQRHSGIRVNSLTVMTLDELVAQVEKARNEFLDWESTHAKDDSEAGEELEHLRHVNPSDLRRWLSSAGSKGFWTQKGVHYVKLYNKNKKKYFVAEKFVFADIIQVAGWKGTTVSPWDLGATEIKCRCLCHFGCKTYKHNWKILRHKDCRNWRQQGNERYAYFTSALAYNYGTNFFLYNILTYNKRSAFLSWKPLLEDAVKKTNNDLANARAGFEIV